MEGSGVQKKYNFVSTFSLAFLSNAVAFVYAIPITLEPTPQYQVTPIHTTSNQFQTYRNDLS